MKRSLSILILLFCASYLSAQTPSNLYDVRTEAEFFKLQVKDSDFVYFWKDNCSWCDLQSPIITRLAQKFKTVRFIKVNNSSIAIRNQVFYYPSMKFKGERYTGYQDQQSLENILR